MRSNGPQSHVRLTVEALTTSQYLRALFRNALGEIALAHLENPPYNKIDPNRFLFSWVDWLLTEPLHVHVSTANNGPAPRPPSLVWPWPVPSPLPRVYFEFCVVLVTLHECFHLVSYQNFPDYDTPHTSKLPDGNAGIAAELAFFKGRVLTEWDVGHVGDFRYLCGLYLKTHEGDVPIEHDDVRNFMSEIRVGGSPYKWDLKAGRAVHAPKRGKGRVFAVDLKKPPKAEKMARKAVPPIPGRIRTVLITNCHD
ncbi:hypothetical protein DFH06DRAFT_1444154 [Mycena polygramma]|nr:hypothetical protein DFH06DRAFT_1444154 [Mycena polygramma]